jgi:alkylation response protein AidB-like acyl-CoA dehydrogenase
MHREFDPAFAKEVGGTGWLGLTWPKKFGGMERGPYELLAFQEEMTRADAPRAGSPIQAVSWMIYGSPEQQQRYLPELLNGEVMYGMWYSEPNSGSDLASLRTRAERDGDSWVINGEKIWTTTYWGDYMWLAARTDPAAKPQHAGISVFVVRTDTPGITRRPINTMYDGEFCNTFFDNVRLPADALVGEVNKGWEVLTGALGTERAFVGSQVMAKICHHFEEVCDHIRTVEANGKRLSADPIVRDTIGNIAAQLEVGRQLSIRPVTILASGVEPTWEAALPKVFAGELMERFGEAALDLLGQSATLSVEVPDAPIRGRIEQKLRHSLMWVISLGTNEIQRNMIAQRGLGLPR